MVQPVNGQLRYGSSRYSLEAGSNRMQITRGMNVNFSSYQNNGMSISKSDDNNFSASKQGMPNNLARIFVNGDVATYVYLNGEVQMKPTNCLTPAETQMNQQIRHEAQMAEQQMKQQMQQMQQNLQQNMQNMQQNLQQNMQQMQHNMQNMFGNRFPYNQNGGNNMMMSNGMNMMNNGQYMQQQSGYPNNQFQSINSLSNGYGGNQMMQYGNPLQSMFGNNFPFGTNNSPFGNGFPFNG